MASAVNFGNAISILALGNSATSIYNSLSSGSPNVLSIMNSAGQIVATISSVNPAATIATTPGAMSVTAGQMIVDWSNSDYSALAGDTLTIISEGAFLTSAVMRYVPGGQGIATIALVVGAATGAAGLAWENSSAISNTAGRIFDAISNGLQPQLSLADFFTLNSFNSTIPGDGSWWGGSGAAFDTAVNEYYTATKTYPPVPPDPGPGWRWHRDNSARHARHAL